MMKLEFEWHDAKAKANWRDHGVNFEQRIRLISARRVTQYEQEDYFWQNA